MSEVDKLLLELFEQNLEKLYARRAEKRMWDLSHVMCQMIDWPDKMNIGFDKDYKQLVQMYDLKLVDAQCNICGDTLCFAFCPKHHECCDSCINVIFCDVNQPLFTRLSNIIKFNNFKNYDDGLPFLCEIYDFYTNYKAASIRKVNNWLGVCAEEQEKNFDVKNQIVWDLTQESDHECIMPQILDFTKM